jgi:hypothetical protein
MGSVNGHSLLRRGRHYRISGLTVLAGLFFCAQSAQDGFAHLGIRRPLSGPEFPLRDALWNKHFYPGNCRDSPAGSEVQEPRHLRPVDEVHNDAAI